MGLATLNNIVEKTDSLTDGLVGYWPLNEGKDNIVYDYSGNKQNGLSNKQFDWDNGLNFNNRIITITNKQINFLNSFTKTLWAKTNTLSGNHQLIRLVSGNHQFYQSGVNLRFYNGSIFHTSSNCFTLNSYLFISLLYNGVTMQTYLNGNLYQNTQITTNIGINNIYIGSGIGISEPFDGKIKDVRIYARVLSPFEIKKLYNLGLSNIQNTKSII